MSKRILLLLLLPLVSPTLSTQSQIEFETYTNEDFNFSIDYPSDGWGIKETGLQKY
jgi:hypothetical protein